MAPLELYSSAGDVVHLTEANFDKFVMQSDRLWVVQFYAPWCRFCCDYAEEYSKAATALKGVVSVGAINSAFEQSLIARRFPSIKALPTIKFFGRNKDEPEDYNGERSAPALIEATLAMLRKQVYYALIQTKKKQ